MVQRTRLQETGIHSFTIDVLATRFAHDHSCQVTVLSFGLGVLTDRSKPLDQGFKLVNHFSILVN